MLFRRQLLLGAAASSGILASCASAPEPRTADSRTYCMSTLRTKRTVCTPEPVPSAAAEADAKRFEATPGVLTVYVVRSAWLDAVRPLTVSIDGDSQIGTLPRSLIRLRHFRPRPRRCLCDAQEPRTPSRQRRPKGKGVCNILNENMGLDPINAFQFHCYPSRKSGALVAKLDPEHAASIDHDARVSAIGRIAPRKGRRSR